MKLDRPILGRMRMKDRWVCTGVRDWPNDKFRGDFSKARSCLKNYSWESVRGGRDWGKRAGRKWNVYKKTVSRLVNGEMRAQKLFLNFVRAVWCEVSVCLHWLILSTTFSFKWPTIPTGAWFVPLYVNEFFLSSTIQQKTTEWMN